MSNPHHQELLGLIRKKSGTPTQHSFLDSYLGNDHPKYPIDNPTLRVIARDWMRSHRDLDPATFRDILTSLIEAESCTEKVMAGILMGYSARNQRVFSPGIFDDWLDHLTGWVEVDSICTGDFIASQLPDHWPVWKKLILSLSKNDNIDKRRASLVLFCSPLSRVKDDRIVATALRVVDRLKSEKDVRITKAVSWVLRSMIKHHRATVSSYLEEKKDTLPAIAVRETSLKLKTGKKNPRR